MTEERVLGGLTEEQSEYVGRQYDQTYSWLYARARAALMDQDLAEEAVQETFMIACKRIDEFHRHENPHGWLMITMRYTIQNIRRRNTTVALISAMTPNAEPEDNRTSFRETDLDVTCASLVGEENYWMFKAYTLKEISMWDAAQGLGISLEACKKRMQRIRKALYKEFSR